MLIFFKYRYVKIGLDLLRTADTLSLVCYWLISFKTSGLMTLTFLLAPPSDTLGLVLKSPSKLNIFRFFPLTDSEVATNTWKRKWKEKQSPDLISNSRVNSYEIKAKWSDDSNFTLQLTLGWLNRFFHHKSKLMCFAVCTWPNKTVMNVKLDKFRKPRHTINFS